MSRVDELAREIVSREGGYVDHPNDPGGATKYGVTIHTMRALGLDLNRDGAVNKADVKALSLDQAVDIFIGHYFEKPRINLLPEILQDTVFDMQVNAGGNAVKILQRLLREMGFNVAVDGALGPQSAGAAHEAAKKGAQELRDAYGIARRNYYFRIADRNAKLRVFARSRSGGKGGWIKRAEEFISPRYHMSDAQFQDRTRNWQ